MKTSIPDSHKYTRGLYRLSPKEGALGCVAWCDGNHFFVMGCGVKLSVGEKSTQTEIAADSILELLWEEPLP